MSAEIEVYKPKNYVRVVTATSLFDGHDAAINIMRRILQDTGVEVIHLGHNRSVQEIVDAAIEEDVQGVAVSSYQGGHIEFFKYLVDLLKEREAAHIKVFGGGGGVIVPEEIRTLESYGVTKIYSPEDGARLGLQGMINDERGRWLIEGEGYAELALTGVIDGRIESVVLDRVRIDEDQTHWIVDYKTSSHEGGDLQSFLNAESDRYRSQLSKYAALYQNYSGANVRCALYFPLLQKFVEVA